VGLRGPSICRPCNGPPINVWGCSALGKSLWRNHNALVKNPRCQASPGGTSANRAKPRRWVQDEIVTELPNSQAACKGLRYCSLNRPS
jgi:hypothetical protein